MAYKNKKIWLTVILVLLAGANIYIHAPKSSLAKSRRWKYSGRWDYRLRIWVGKRIPTIAGYIWGPPKPDAFKPPPRTHGWFQVSTHPCKTSIEVNGKVVGETKCRVEYRYNEHRMLAEDLTVKAIPLEPGLWVESKTFKAGTRPRSIRFTYPLKKRTALPSGEKPPWSSSTPNKSATASE
jgi:hypothetical protein